MIEPNLRSICSCLRRLRWA